MLGCVFRDTGTQTRPCETQDKGVNCSTLHIRLTASDIASDSLALLYTGLPSESLRTLDNVTQNLDDPLKFNMLVSDQILLVQMKLRLFCSLQTLQTYLEYPNLMHAPF